MNSHLNTVVAYISVDTGALRCLSCHTAHDASKPLKIGDIGACDESCDACGIDIAGSYARAALSTKTRCDGFSQESEEQYYARVEAAIAKHNDLLTITDPEPVLG